MLALQLAKRGVQPLLIDRAEACGRGIAYGTGDVAHLLNVPAMKMSAWPDEPGDFAEDAGLADGAFAERRAYGDYLRGKLERAVADAQIIVADAQAVSANRTGEVWRIVLDDGREVEADKLALATGNGRPDPFEIPGWPDEAMVQDPWSAEAQSRLEQAARDSQSVLLIGTGLTMVDLVLTLDRMGHDGPVTAVSRRGVIPRAHVPGIAPLPPPDPKEIPESLGDAVAWLRARGLGVDWRAAVDSLRPITQALWAGWPDTVKARFLRHARPWWDVHRHRIAPEAAAVIDRWCSAGRLKVIAGRVREGANGTATVIRRGDGPVTIEAELAINCTGPAGPLAATRNPLLRQMLADGLVQPGPLGIGIRTGAMAEAREKLWALGPLTKGQWWEITAVPDIRVQVDQVAAAMTDGD